MDPRQRLIFALDVPDRDRALWLVEALAPHVGCFKIGLELFVAEGPALVREIAARGPVFLDLKLHDIPATVGRAAAVAAKLGVTYLTVHPEPDALRAAVDAAPDVGILCVSVLTSVSVQALAAATGRADVPPEQVIGQVVVERALLARDAGCRGLICSGQEAARVRAAVGPDLLVITPGVRPVGSSADDQARVVTPAAAIAAGADMIVVGRPIREAADPTAAARAILASL